MHATKTIGTHDDTHACIDQYSNTILYVDDSFKVQPATFLAHALACRLVFSMQARFRFRLFVSGYSQLNQYFHIRMVNTVPKDWDRESATYCRVIIIMRKYWANTSRSPRLAAGREHGARARRAGVATNRDFSGLF